MRSLNHWAFISCLTAALALAGMYAFLATRGAAVLACELPIYQGSPKPRPVKTFSEEALTASPIGYTKTKKNNKIKRFIRSTAGLKQIIAAKASTVKTRKSSKRVAAVTPHPRPTNSPLKMKALRSPQPARLARAKKTAQMKAAPQQAGQPLGSKPKAATKRAVITD